MAFIQNPNYDPNDPTSQRYVTQESIAPTSVTIVDPFADNQQGVEIVEPAIKPAQVSVVESPGEAIIEQPASTAPAKQIYRIGKDIFNASTNQRLSPDEFARDFSGKATEIAPPQKTDLAGIAGGLDIAPLGGEIVEDLGGLQNLISKAAKAGLSYSDTLKLVQEQTGVTGLEREEIRGKLGVPGLIEDVFTRPSADTQEIYTRAFNESGLPKIKRDIAEIDEQISTIRDQASIAMTGERKNPFISQATRTGRLRIIQQDAEQKIGNLSAQKGQLLNVYNRGIGEIEGVISRFTGQLEEDRALSVGKLNFLLSEAERQAGGLAEERGREALRFMPEFLDIKGEVDPFSKEALDIQLQMLEIQKKQKELDGIVDPIETRKKQLELEKLEADVAKAKGIAKPLSQTEINILEDKVTLINELITHPGLNNVVGTFKLGRLAFDPISGNAQDFVGKVKQLISKETIDTLVNLKARGGTLGALSDQERILLQNAATAIGGWEIKKDGIGTGRFNVKEATFKRELKKIQDLAQRAIDATGGGEVGLKKDFDSIGFDTSYEEALKLYGQDGLTQIIESQKKNDKVSISVTGMRTDRHNNPTAFTIDIAKQAGLREGVDYQVGDAFPNNPNQKTARLLGDPVDQTIKVIDKIGFYTRGGSQRWTHTAMSKSQWDALSDSAKKQVVQQMYQREGNKGELNKYFA